MTPYVLGWIACGLLPTVQIMLWAFYVGKEDITFYDIKMTGIAILLGPVFLIIFVLYTIKENMPADNKVIFRNKRK